MSAVLRRILCVAIVLHCVGLVQADLADQEILQTAIEEDRLQAAIMRSEVSQALKDALGGGQSDVTADMDQLKNMRESIIESPSLSSSARSELLDRIGQGLRQLSQRRIEQDRLDDAARANDAALQARRHSLDRAIRQDDRVSAYLDQINALLDERRFELSGQVAGELREQADGRVASHVALTKVNQIGNRARAVDLDDLSARRFTDTLYQVERSHVPVPDDPPISYPSAHKWRELTERRKARYSRFDLKVPGPAERRIASALDSQATLAFLEEPLANAISMIEEKHGIQIEFDVRALEDEDVDTSDTVSIDVSNITLRSALRLMLSNLDLTYVMDNEVLMITSKAEAEKLVVTRVYPVGDLVMPVNSLLGVTGGGLGGGGIFGGGGAPGGSGFSGGFGQGAGGQGAARGGFGQGALNGGIGAGGGRNGGGIF